MTVFYNTSTDQSVEHEYSVYEYDNSGLVTFTQRYTGPLDTSDYAYKPLESNNGEHRYIVEHDIGNTSFEDLLEGSIFTLNEEHGPVGVLTAVKIIDIYLHITLTDGDGKLPIGIKNDGIDSMNVLATFRQSDDPESPVITAIDNTEWRVTVRDTDNKVYDIVNIVFHAGVLNFNYATTNAPNMCRIIENDFEIVNMGASRFKINLVGDTNFKVFRQFITE